MAEEMNNSNQTVNMSIEEVLESIEENNSTSNLPTTIITPAQVAALASMSTAITYDYIDHNRLAALESETKTKEEEIQQLKRQLLEANETARTPEPDGDECESESASSDGESDDDDSEAEPSSDEEPEVYRVDNDGDVNVSDPTVGSSETQYSAPPNQMDLPGFYQWEIDHYDAPRRSKMKKTTPLQLPGRLASSTPTDKPNSPPVKPIQPTKKSKFKRVRQILESEDEQDSMYDPMTENAQNPNSRVLHVQTTPKKVSINPQPLIELDPDSEDDFQKRPTKRSKYASNPYIHHSAKEDNRMDLDLVGCSSKHSPTKRRPKFRQPSTQGVGTSSLSKGVQFPYNTTYYKRNGSQWKDGRFAFHHNLTKIALASISNNGEMPIQELEVKLNALGQTVYKSSEAMCKHRWWQYIEGTYNRMQTPSVPSFMQELICDTAQPLKPSSIRKFRLGYLPNQNTYMQVKFYLGMISRSKVTTTDMCELMKDFD